MARELSHEWIKIEGIQAVVGITAGAKEEIGDIVGIELPIIGKEIKKGEAVCLLESTKSAIELYSPAEGCITEVNTKLTENIALLNEDPEKDGWIFKMELKA